MIGYLWKERSHKPLFSREWCKSWAKRILLLPAIVRAVANDWYVRATGVRIGELSFVHPLRLTGKRSLMSVGDHSVVGRASISLHERLQIGSHVVVNDDVTILTASHRTASTHWEQFSMEIVIEDYAWIAVGATILPGVRIGRGAVVGAFAVVRSDVPAYQVVVGNPAAPTGRTRPENLAYDPVRDLAFVRAWVA